MGYVVQQPGLLRAVRAASASSRVASASMRAPDGGDSYGRPHRSFRGVAAALALFTTSLVAPESLVRSVAGPLGGVVGGTRSAIAAPQTQTQVRVIGSAARKQAKLALKTKLGKVPVFMVTNDGGSPFLNQQSNGDQSAVMFLYPGDAERMLKAVMKAPNGATSGAKVLPSNLDRAFKLAMMPPSLSGLRDQASGRELSMSWQFKPSAGEMRAAQALSVKTAKAPVVPKIPAYTATGLRVKKHGKEVQPIFLSARDAEAALKKLDVKAKLEVYDLMEVLQDLHVRLELGDPSIPETINGIEFVPPSESTEFRTDLKNSAPRRKARIVPPNHNQR